MKALVTGSSGFIGRHLASYLYDKGLDIIPFDLQIGLDIRNEVQIEQAVKKADVVFHQAAANLIASREDPEGDLQTNAAGTLRLLESCRKYKVQRLIIASTGSVFGKDGLPGTPYGISKHAAEQYGRYYHQYHHLPVTILRYYGVYGPLMSTEKRGVIGIFLKKALTGSTLHVQGGAQKRSFIHVADVVQANWAALEHPETVGLTLDVGNPFANIAIGELAQRIVDEYGTEGTEITYGKARSGDDIRHLPDIAQWAEFSWYPKIDLISGIQTVATWLNSQSF